MIPPPPSRFCPIARGPPRHNPIAEENWNHLPHDRRSTRPTWIPPTMPWMPGHGEIWLYGASPVVVGSPLLYTKLKDISKQIKELKDSTKEESVMGEREGRQRERVEKYKDRRCVLCVHAERSGVSLLKCVRHV